MDPRTLHTRLGALAAGIAVAACVVAAVCVALPVQSDVRDGVDYGYVYSGAKSSSVAFAEAAMTDESLIVFGSSEFSTPRRVVPQVPSQVFGTADTGLRLMLVGEAFDQSLWHALALGAFDRAGIPRGKVAIIVTPGWFVDGGQDAETFKTRFSYSMYRAFCANDRIPAEVGDYVRGRLADYGVDAMHIAAASPQLPQDYLNAWALDALDDLKLRQGLLDVRERGMDLVDADVPTPPDFAALRAEAEVMGAERSAGNDWGVDDGFYEQQLEPVLADAKDSRVDETYADTPEYDDLNCFLDVAAACGVDVLVVLAPELGPYYDHLGISAQTRAGCYDRVRAVVQRHAGDGARLADFSDREYEKYFLYDIVHFGWTGWVDVEQSIYDFAQDGA